MASHIPPSVIDHGGQTRIQAHEWQQVVPPSVERALERWAIKMDTQEFPPRLDLFKAIAVHLAQKQADEDDDSSIVELVERFS